MLADRIFGAPARRDPPRRRKKPARGRNPKPAARGRGRGRRRASPEVMQRRLDLTGLACIGLAVYLGYVIYLGWNGGTVGDGSHTALSYAVGAGAIVVPVALGLAGVGLILRPFLPSPKSVAVGVAAIACGLLLALAAQTAGLGPEGARTGLFDPAFCGSPAALARTWSAPGAAASIAPSAARSASQPRSRRAASEPIPT